MLKIALQLYSVRDYCSKDLKRTLEEVASIGYEGVEFAGFYGYWAEELRDILKSLGLKVAGAHIGLSELSDEKISSTIAYQKTIGNENVVVPSLPKDFTSSKEGWLKAAELFNSLLDKLKKEGLKLGYHNHRLEFETRFNGITAWELFFKNTSQDVFIQLDIGHAIAAGNTTEELIRFIDEFPGRVKSVHVKDYSKVKGYNVFIGEGDIRWNQLLNALKGVEWFIIEQEEYKGLTSIEAVREDFKNFKKFLERLV
ncbi:MAG: sugar phosphate isomerase/epimerase [Sulfolobaceae archaeon]|nr:sugar phosphate isomerase/epimerase [Sulfolobaceae archaeon]